MLLVTWLFADVLQKYYGFASKMVWLFIMFTERISWTVVLCRVRAVIWCRAAVEAGKHTGLCVSWELVLILGGLSFLFAGCHGNISARTQSDVYICGTAAWETAESQVTPSSLFTPSTSLSHFHHLSLLTCRRQISVLHAFHAWILLILHHLFCCFFYFYIVSLFLADVSPVPF